MKDLARNKQALRDYELLEEFEGGLALLGPEVKSAKAGHVQLKGAFLHIEGGELWLKNAYIAPYKPAGEQAEYDPYRSRKVLAHKKEIGRLAAKSDAQGLTIVPISVSLRGNLLKLRFALARGKKKHEKRETKKKQEVERMIRARLRGDKDAD